MTPINIVDASGDIYGNVSNTLFSMLQKDDQLQVDGKVLIIVGKRYHIVDRQIDQPYGLVRREVVVSPAKGAN